MNEIMPKRIGISNKVRFEVLPLLKESTSAYIFKQRIKAWTESVNGWNKENINPYE